MAKVTLKHDIVSDTCGELPAVGSPSPAFTLVGGDLSEKSLADYSGKKKVLNIVPSFDTPTCATSARKFNELAANKENVVVLLVSLDLPFAQGRFCSAEGLEGVEPVSAFRSTFPDDFGIKIIEGPLKGLCGRAVVVIDENDTVVYQQLVTEISEEPDYDAALSVLG